MDFFALSTSRFASNEIYLAREIFLTSYSLWSKKFPLENPYDYYWTSHFDIRDVDTLGNAATYCYPMPRGPDNLKIILNSMIPEGSPDFKSNYKALIKVPNNTIIICLSVFMGFDKIPYPIYIAKAKKDPTKMCWYCTKPTTLKCSKCNVGNFCDRDCQTKYWPIHKQVCGKIEKYINIDITLQKLIFESS